VLQRKGQKLVPQRSCFICYTRAKPHAQSLNARYACFINQATLKVSQAFQAKNAVGTRNLVAEVI
jgi:hypothetical protein